MGQIVWDFPQNWPKSWVENSSKKGGNWQTLDWMKMGRIAWISTYPVKIEVQGNIRHLDGNCDESGGIGCNLSYAT
jgi:hypothetical protein